MKGKKITRRKFLKELSLGIATAPFLGTELTKERGEAAQSEPKDLLKKIPKVLLIGLDSCDMPRLIEWAERGELPTFKYLMTRGVYGALENIFRGMSVDAWAAYLTGVGPGQNNFFGSHSWTLYDRSAGATSGINRFFRLHAATVPFMLDAAGIRVGLCGFPMTWPPERLKNGFMMSGKGAPGLGDGVDVRSHVYYTAPKHRAAGPLKTKIAFSNNKVNTVIRFRRMQISLELILDPLLNSVTIKYNDLRLTLKRGEWSKYVPIQFPDGRKAITRWKPEKLDATIGELQLYRYRFLQDPSAPLQHNPISEFFDGACVPTDQWTYPASLQKEVYDAVGYYRTPNLPFEYDYPGFMGYVQEEETLIEDCYDATREQTDIASWLLKNKPWDFFAFANMPHDRLNHNMSRIEGNPDWSPEYEAKYGNSKVMKDHLKFFDKELARILKVVPEDTYIIFISDHGWGPVKKEFQPNSWLRKIGLLQVKPEVERKRRRYEFPDDVDWKRTKAYSADNPGIFINLKGREPNGVVDYSEYEKLRDFIIEELKKVLDPEGDVFVHIAERVENIYKGNYGWYAGDVQFCGYRDSSGIKVPGRVNDGLYPINWTGFGKRDAIWDDPRRHWTAWHGNALTSFIMTGPGVKKNMDISKGGHMMNVIPTVFYIFGLVPPPNFEGRIMYEIFEPDYLLAKENPDCIVKRTCPHLLCQS